MNRTSPSDSTFHSFAHRRMLRVARVVLILSVMLTATASSSSVLLGLSTRLGGTGADSVRDVTTDAAGNIYLTGSTSSTDFSGTVTSPVGADVFVAKLDPTGQEILYLELFGGDAFDEAWGIEIDAAGNAYVAGYTTSASFPVGTAFDTTVDNTDAFLLKLDPSGTLLYATLFGGPDADGEFNGGLGIHPATGRVYIGSRTNSTALAGVNAFSTFCPNAPCAFIAGFDPSLPVATSLVYMTYVTAPSALATQEDGGLLDLDVDSAGHLYGFGFVNPNSQVVLAGQGFQDASGDLNNNDHVLVKLDPSLAGSGQRIYSTFIGGFGDESERGRIAALDSGVVYVGSKTDSNAATFPVLNAFQPVNAGGDDGYVAKIDTTVSGPGSQIFTTFLGSALNDEINAITVDSAENAWIAATVSGGGSNLFPQVFPLPGTPIPGVDGDAAVARIAADGSSLYFSGPSVAGASAPFQGIAIQPSGRVLVAGSRNNPDFPLLGGLSLDSVAGNDIALVGLDVVGDLGLVLEASVTDSPAATGETFAIQYLVKNFGTGAAANGILTTDFPVSLTASSASANCSFPGTSSTCEFFENVPRGYDTPVYFLASAATDGLATLNGSVTSDLFDPSPADDVDSVSVTTNAQGSYPASLTLADFDIVAPAFDGGAFALDTSTGVLATPNGTEGDVVNLMVNDTAVALHIESILGQGEVALGYVDNGIWMPSAGDGSDLFGRDFNGAADRVFAIIDGHGRVELRTARAFNEGRVIGTGFIPLGRPGLVDVIITPTLASVRFDGFVVASGDPFTTDFRDALPSNVGDDFVVSVGFGTESRGAAILNVPEPSRTMALSLGALLLLGGFGRRSRQVRSDTSAELPSPMRIHSRSKIAAIPCPPPIHIVTSA